jgi:hypothetical protein
MTEATTTTTPPAPAPAPAAPAIAWMPDATPEVAGYIQNKAWQSPADMFSSYQNLEKFVGAEKAGRAAVIPSDDDVEGWNKFHAKLGRPEQPGGYELPVPDGADKVFSEKASAWFHEAGLSKKAAQHIAAKWNDHVAQVMQAQVQEEQTKLQAEHQALERDWGAGDAAAVNREMARRAAGHLGLDEQAIDALQKVSGFAKTMKALAKVGEMLGERPAVGLGGGNSFALTPEAAQAKKQALMADKEFREKAMADPNSAQWREIQRLSEIIVAAQERQGQV